MNVECYIASPTLPTNQACLWPEDSRGFTDYLCHYLRLYQEAVSSCARSPRWRACFEGQDWSLDDFGEACPPERQGRCGT